MGPGMKRDPDWFEFREILAHWYQLELCELEEDREAVIEKLVTIFSSEEVQLPNLSRKIQSTLSGQVSDIPAEVPKDKLASPQKKFTHNGTTFLKFSYLDKLIIVGEE